MTQAPRTTLSTHTSLRLNAGVAASVQVLAQTSWGLRRYLEEQAQENPMLRVETVERSPRDWLPRWTAAFARAEGPMAEGVAASASLNAHVMAEVARQFPVGPPRRIAELLADALEPSGWLGRPLVEVAAEARATLPEVEAVLLRLQDIEPVGLFARNLAECLELQAREAGWLDPVMKVILGHLALLAQGDTARLATLARVPEADVLRTLRRVRSLNPKPGAQFDIGEAPLREPDLIASRGEAGWVVALNRSALPSLAVVAPPRGTANPEVAAQVAAARAVVRHVAARGRTILRVGQEVLTRQAAVLDYGVQALVPMTMADVAGTLELHESTVSRAVAGTAVDTPGGTLWLRQLFSGAVGAEGVAAGALRVRLARLVAEENKADPLTDAELAARLDGGAVARRTVVKYRRLMGIPPRHRRRIG